jgi:hypothetical protein
MTCQNALWAGFARRSVKIRIAEKHISMTPQTAKDPLLFRPKL